MRKTHKPKVRDPEAFGAFMPDGSYFAGATLAQRGAADRIVRTLVRSRGTVGFDPRTAAQAIQLTKHEAAFPNLGQWAGDEGDPPAWPHAQTSTAAEEAVKRCGLGVVGPKGEPRHWCGELWVDGPERLCSSPAHRAEHDMERVRALVRSTLGRLGEP